LKWHNSGRAEDGIEAPPRLTVKQPPIVSGSAVFLREQDIPGTKAKDAMACRELERATERDHELPRGVGMPSKLWIHVCFLD
jgi:hypothetical protein